MTNIRPDHPVQYRLRDCAICALFERMSHLPANILAKFAEFLAPSKNPNCIEHCSTVKYIQLYLTRWTYRLISHLFFEVCVFVHLLP